MVCCWCWLLNEQGQSCWWISLYTYWFLSISAKLIYYFFLDKLGCLCATSGLSGLSNVRRSQVHWMNCPCSPTLRYIYVYKYFTKLFKKSIIHARLLKGTVPEVIRYLSFFLNVFKSCYGIGNNVWKFQVSMMKIVPVARIWSLWAIHIIMTRP